MNCAAGAVRFQRARVGNRNFLRASERSRVRSAACGGEQRAVWLLCRMRKSALQTAQENSRPARAKRERVAPHPQCDAEAERRDEHRIRALARQMRSRARDADANRVELPVELGTPQLHAAQ